MPTITESLIEGFAHCRDPRCRGYIQEPVQVVKTTASRTFMENGGDLPGEESSHEYLKFADDKDVPCPVCTKDRECALQSRPTYQALSGYPQDGLLGVPNFDPNKVPEDPRVADLEAKLAEQSARMDALIEALSTPEEPAP